MALYSTPFEGIPSVLENLVALLKPGGWVQLVDADLTGPERNSQALGPSVRLLRELFGKNREGKEEAYVSRLKGWLEDLGCVSLSEKVVDVRLGKMNLTEAMKEKGIKSFCMAAEGFVGAARGKAFAS